MSGSGAPPIALALNEDAVALRLRLLMQRQRDEVSETAATVVIWAEPIVGFHGEFIPATRRFGVRKQPMRRALFAHTGAVKKPQGARHSQSPRTCVRYRRAPGAATSADLGPVGFEPTTKGFTRPRRFRREWTISSPVHDGVRGGAGRSSLLSRALKPSGSLCTFRRCTGGLAQGCHGINTRRVP